MKPVYNITRPTEQYPWAWLAHHRLQYGPNWPHVRHLFATKPPRTRPGQIKPGGRHLRRALTRLETRRINSRDGCTKPGSMKR
jgi:hypothetical protein